MDIKTKSAKFPVSEVLYTRNPAHNVISGNPSI